MIKETDMSKIKFFLISFFVIVLDLKELFVLKKIKEVKE